MLKYKGDIKRFIFKKKRVLLYIALLCIILLLLGGTFEHLPYPRASSITTWKDLLPVWVHAHPASSVIIYICLFVLAEAIGLPCAAFFSLVAGTIFSLPLALASAWFARSVGDLICFFLARLCLRNRFQKSHGQWHLMLKKRFSLEGNILLLALRLVPGLPSSLVTIGVALLPISWTRFFFFNTLGIGFWTVCMVWAAHSAKSYYSGKIITPEYALFAAALAGMALLLYPLMKRHRRNRGQEMPAVLTKTSINDARPDGPDQSDPNG